MFKAQITIEKIEDQVFGATAHLNLNLQNKALGSKVNFKIASTGTALVVNSQHIVSELQQLLSWLNLPSLDEDNLRDNASEIRAIARTAVRAQKEINSTKHL